MKTAILSVGTELLFGQITNTNTVFLSQQLNLLGFDVYYHYTVGDNSRRLGEIIRNIFTECDMIITTGGLGPTEDDLTKETFAEVMGEKLVVHKESMDHLFEIAEKRGRKLTENNYKQGYMPEHATVFFNDAGSAPGFAIEKNGKTAICMPGPPGEMKNMWAKKVKPFLEKKQNSCIYYKTLRFFGIGESSLETRLLDLIDAQGDPTIATYAKEGECSVRVASKRKTLKEAEEAVNDMVKKISERTGEYMFSQNNCSLAETVGKKLIQRNLSISCCESCTGGLFAAELTGVPGISAVFDRGLVTYTEKAKMEELGVKEETLKEYTAVSEETAREMVRGLQNKTGSRVCLSVTGYAGPYGDDRRPAGNIFIGCRFDQKEEIRELNTHHADREWNRRYAMLNMFDMVNKIIG